MSSSIIIIEDNKGVNLSIASLLKRNGFSMVTQVYDRDEAFNELTKKYFDIAIVDLNLEGENVPLPAWRDSGGIHILKMLKSMNLGTKAIVLTASPDTRLAFELARDFDVTDYISKDTEEFVEATVSSIKNAAQSTGINYPDDDIRFYSGIHSGIDRHIWLSNTMHLLDSSVKDLSDFFTEMYQYFYPAFFSKAVPGLCIDKDNDILRGKIWSFKLGKALDVVVKRNDNNYICDGACIEKKFRELTFIAADSSTSYAEIIEDAN